VGRIWAVAVHTVREAIRMKVVLAFAFFILVLVLTLPIAVQRPDSGVSSNVQAFLSWFLRPLGTLLTFLAIFLGCLSLSDEMVGKQIYTIVTKPVPRWQYVVGKWLGTVLVLTGLLFFGGISSYCMAKYLAAADNPDPVDQQKLANEVLVARANSPLVMPDFTAAAKKKYQLYRDEGRISDLTKVGEKEAIAKYFQEMVQTWRSVPPGQVREYEFKGIKRGFLSDDDDMQLRYKAKGMGYAQDETLQTIWIFGDYGTASQTGQIQRKDVMDRYHTIPFKASAVSLDGTLKVYVLNMDHLRSDRKIGATIAFEAAEGFEVLYVIGTFEGNLFRTLFLILCRVSLISAVAVCCATLVSYPVACLMAFLFYVLSVGGDYVMDALDFGKKGEGPLGMVQYIVEPILEFLFWMWPKFKEFDAVETFVNGRVVSLVWDIQGFGKLVLMLSTVFLIIACIIFRRRQVAELSV